MSLTNSDLKIIAIITMIIDHVGLVFFNDTSLYYPLRCIGRISFPIFIFLLIEGFLKTKNLNKYTLNLFAFALISEIPYDLLFFNKIVCFERQNIFFTLLLGVLMLRIINKIEKNEVFSLIGLVALFAIIFSLISNQIIGLLLFIVILCLIFKKKINMTSFGILLIAYILSVIFSFDYAGIGILAIYIGFIFRKNKLFSRLGTCLSLSLNNYLSLFSCLSIFFINAYNGKRGKNYKYLFYIIYPAHLIILYIIS